MLGLKSDPGRFRTSSCHVPSPGWDSHDAEILHPDQAWAVFPPVCYGSLCQGKLCCVLLKLCLQLYGAFSGFIFPNFSRKCKCRALDTRTRPKKDLQCLLRFLFLPQERSQDSAHPCVRVPLSRDQRHAPSSPEPHSNFPFALTFPYPCMQLGGLCGLDLERTHSGPRICSLEQMAVEGGVSYMTWTARLSSPLP